MDIDILLIRLFAGFAVSILLIITIYLAVTEINRRNHIKDMAELGYVQMETDSGELLWTRKDDTSITN